jgi:hypothetical protein
LACSCGVVAGGVPQAAGQVRRQDGRATLACGPRTAVRVRHQTRRPGDCATPLSPPTDQHPLHRTVSAVRVRHQTRRPGDCAAPLSPPLRCSHPPLMPVLSSAHAEMTALPKGDTNWTTPSLIPTVTGNTVRSFSTHGQQSAAKGSSTTCLLRSDIRFNSTFGLLGSRFGPEVALNWRCFLIHARVAWGR